MKSAIAVSAFLALSAAAPFQHRHHEHHEHKRAVTVTILQYADVDNHAYTPTASASRISRAKTSPTETAVAPSSVTSASSIVSSTLSSAPSSTASSGSSESSGSSGSGAGGVQGDLGAFSDPTVPFEDGVHDCDKLPTGQGVVPITWISGLNGGFSSIMNMNGDTSATCKDGFYCSYACQAGMSKTQWPQTQPASGISVGGLLCKNGKLYKSNPSQKYLCGWGAKSSTFVSKINKDVAICRTDYPGSENMNVPTLLKAGSTAPVSVVDSDSYYTWKGGKTSTQYYVNNAGVSIEKGCIWGTDGSGIGNWAPVVLGAGTTGGNTYLSLIPNPNNRTPPNYNIKIEGTSGSTTVGSCSYEGGQYSGGHGSDGCTLTVSKGSANFIFY